MTLVGHGIVTRMSQGITCVFRCHRLGHHSGYVLTRGWLSESSTLSSTTTELHIAYTTLSREPLDPSTQLPYRHAHDPTAPIPYYNPTARARYKWARSWAQKPALPPAHDASALVHHESEEGPAQRPTLRVATNTETRFISQPATPNVYKLSTSNLTSRVSEEGTKFAMHREPSVSV